MRIFYIYFVKLDCLDFKIFQIYFIRLFLFDKTILSDSSHLITLILKYCKRMLFIRLDFFGLKMFEIYYISHGFYDVKIVINLNCSLDLGMKWKYIGYENIFMCFIRLDRSGWKKYIIYFIRLGCDDMEYLNLFKQIWLLIWSENISNLINQSNLPVWIWKYFKIISSDCWYGWKYSKFIQSDLAALI